MENTLFGVGIACILAAIVGGGLRALGFEFPLLKSIPRQVLLFLVGVGLAMAGRLEQVKPYLGFCPQVAGVWQRSTDGLVLQLKQEGCSIAGTAKNATFDHVTTGNFDRSAKAFTIETRRRNNPQECTTQMFGTIRLASEILIVDVAGTDGRCDLPTNFKESSEWVKLQGTSKR
jgi:hypothetical protein